MENIDEWMKIEDKKLIVEKLFNEGYKILEIKTYISARCGEKSSGIITFDKGEDKRSILLEGKLFDEVRKKF
ncbi:hypothetical protein FDC49_01865 [Clostridium sporogenes]|uniref:hypothetical protein n=1 Tax=Clostridium TaxID=1485 RepID=UPI000957B5E3|nr:MULTISPECIES: hypothetical protein [Clostridium]APU60749.1 hypothetical protein NPD8_2708 [Clostridium botulinum]NFG98650.1 hypothetical protein [Clostridium sporogenes]NFH30960.1 hypothetical protein [Clostridium sporogenes]NFL18541.1 hypothetical protein [Clostridium sporogenes]NFN73398.1 hypothetical protein [Clostridium sporogenes]